MEGTILCGLIEQGFQIQSTLMGIDVKDGVSQLVNGMVLALWVLTLININTNICLNQCIDNFTDQIDIIVHFSSFLALVDLFDQILHLLHKSRELIIFAVTDNFLAKWREIETTYIHLFQKALSLLGSQHLLPELFIVQIDGRIGSCRHKRSLVEYQLGLLRSGIRLLRLFSLLIAIRVSCTVFRVGSDGFVAFGIVRIVIHNGMPRNRAGPSIPYA